MKKILQLAIDCHGDQLRKESGMPYAFHLVSVANKLVKCGIFDEVMIAAALLHDVSEDTSMLRMDLEPHLDRYFKEDQEKTDKVLSIVDELTCYAETKQDKIDYLSSFATKSVESLVIKVLDRVDNVEDYRATNPTYAKKYLKKADAVIQAFECKQDEIVARFGERPLILMKDMVRDCYKSLLMYY